MPQPLSAYDRWLAARDRSALADGIGMIILMLRGRTPSDEELTDVMASLECVVIGNDEEEPDEHKD